MEELDERAFLFFIQTGLYGDLLGAITLDQVHLLGFHRNFEGILWLGGAATSGN